MPRSLGLAELVASVEAWCSGEPILFRQLGKAGVTDCCLFIYLGPRMLRNTGQACTLPSRAASLVSSWLAF